MSAASKFTVLIAASLTICSVSQAAPSRVKLKGKMPRSGLSAITTDQNNLATTSTKQKFTLSPSSNKVRLAALQDDAVEAVTVFGIKKGSKVYNVANARAKGICAENAEAITAARLKAKRNSLITTSAAAALNIGTLRLDEENGMLYTKRTLPRNVLDTASGVGVDDNCVPSGFGKLGLSTQGSNSGNNLLAEEGGPVDDPDSDGIPNPFDVDDDGDGVLDNDDQNSIGGGVDDADGPKSFWVFSNFHQNMEESLNANAMSVNDDRINQALRIAAGLAIQVIGDGDINDVELDCGELEYCSQGGVGRGKEPFPDGLEFPEEFDSDGDGLGLITPGDSGDFQLGCFADAASGYAAKDKIKPGDVFLQKYLNESNKEVEVPGMLNFIFHTTPAVKTVVTGVQTYTPSYPVISGDAGTSANCFQVPASGDVIVTLTVWRPQRPPIPGSGESGFIDMGNLRLITNIPNGPCSGGPGMGCENGPGLCPSSVYSTTDSNLAIESDGLQDSMGDLPADSSQTFTYTINLTDCIETVSGVTWDAGESVTVPIQMKNVYGDNAAQNICFVR
ncbi:MAG: hypothetical protein DCC75_01405 [Proteobacteria bacterium]|nr:MAG: hypothetical protein DCC75_01405 [Pseudomonadota bacterium]